MKRENSSWVYRVSFWGLLTWMRRQCGFSAAGAENVPAAGGCIIASNHASFLDPPVIGCGVPHRFVRFLARETLFTNPIACWWAENVGVVQLDRTRGDVGALKAALKVLKHGGVLCLFPEGTRTLDGNLQPPKGGIGFLMAKAGVPVVPAYIDGTYKAFPKGAKRVARHPIHVAYGRPLLPEELARYAGDKSGYEELARLVMERIAALRPVGACASS